MTEQTPRLGAGRYIDAAQAPETTVVSLHELNTAYGEKVSGVLRVVPGARTVVTLVHPRQDLTYHVLVPELLARGYAVWTQGTCSVNNDISLVHEQDLLDAAAGQVFLREKCFDHVVTLEHFGGGTLSAFYYQQAGLPAAERLTHTPAGRAVDLTGAQMPLPDAAVFMAPHPGQGALLLEVDLPFDHRRNRPIVYRFRLESVRSRQRIRRTSAQLLVLARVRDSLPSSAAHVTARLDAIARHRR